MEKFNGLEIRYAFDAWGISSQGERTSVSVKIIDNTPVLAEVYFADTNITITENFKNEVRVQSLQLNQYVLGGNGGWISIQDNDYNECFSCDVCSNEWCILDEPLIDGLVDKTDEVTDETKASLIKIFNNLINK
jgi:hypothetical protein